MADPATFLPMEARSIEALPVGTGWHYEPKWDGFRCLAEKSGGDVALRSKSGKSLGRYFPDIVAALAELPAERFILDGELLAETDTGYDFAELQLRLHPAESRVKKLAAANPASFMLFDLLEDAEGNRLIDAPLAWRRQALEDFYARYGKASSQLCLSPQTDSLTEALNWLESMPGRIDGIMAKCASDPYLPEVRQMQKFKLLRTADCVVGGFRCGTNSKLVGSLLLGLYDDAGKLNHVGYTSSIPRNDKKAWTEKLEALAGGAGFTGSAPGGPSRWSMERSTKWEPLRPELVVEVRFDHVSGNRFRHGTTLLRERPDKAPRQCTMEQLRQPPVQS